MRAGQGRAQVNRPAFLRRRAALTWLLGSLLCMALSACQRDSPPEGPTATLATEAPSLSAPESSPEEPTPSPAASPTPDEAAAVVEAYLAYWDTYFRANQDPPEASYDDLADVATGPAYETVRSSTFAYREAGRVFRRPTPSVVDHEVEVVALTDDAATVADCYVDDAWIETVATGERVNEGAGTQRNTGELVREDGAWKVVGLVTEESFEGVAGCAAA